MAEGGPPHGEVNKLACNGVALEFLEKSREGRTILISISAQNNLVYRIQIFTTASMGISGDFCAMIVVQSMGLRYLVAYYGRGLNGWQRPNVKTRIQ